MKSLIYYFHEGVAQTPAIPVLLGELTLSSAVNMGLDAFSERCATVSLLAWTRTVFPGSKPTHGRTGGFDLYFIAVRRQIMDFITAQFFVFC